MTKKSFVQEKYFCSDSSPGQIECSEDNRTEVLHSKCSKKRLHVQKRSKRTYNCCKNRLSSKCSPRNSVCIFDNPAQTFLPNVWIVSAQKTNMMKNFILLQNLFFHKLFPLDKQFGFLIVSLQNFPANVEQFFADKIRCRWKDFLPEKQY